MTPEAIKLKKKIVRLFHRLSFLYKRIHSSYYREIENSDFNVRQSMGAGMYFSNCMRDKKLTDLVSTLIWDRLVPSDLTNKH